MLCYKHCTSTAELTHIQILTEKQQITHNCAYFLAFSRISMCPAWNMSQAPAKYTTRSLGLGTCNNDRLHSARILTWFCAKNKHECNKRRNYRHLQIKSTKIHSNMNFTINKQSERTVTPAPKRRMVRLVVRKRLWRINGRGRTTSPSSSRGALFFSEEASL